MLYTFSIHYRCRFQTPEEYDTTLLLSEDDDDDDSDTGVPAKDIKISNSGVIKRTDTELLCQKTFEYGSEQLSHCYDDRACKVYGDCCRDSKYYVESEQTVTAAAGVVFNNSRYGCYETEGVYSATLMIGTCPRTSSVAGDRDKCERGSATYPVTGAADGHAYTNAYCAWCRGERRRVVYWKPLFRCYGRDGGPALKSGRLEDAADRTLLHRDGRWYYADYDRLTLLTCTVLLERPDVAPASRPCVPSGVGLVDGCPAGAPAALVRACASYTYVVYENTDNGGGPKDARVFRNVDCARCNGVPVNRTTCLPPLPRLRLGFQTLFSLRSAGEDIGGGHQDPCAQDEIYDVLAAKCRDVIRDELQPATGTGCRELAAFGPDEYDARSLDNETAYVYVYKKRVRYRDGPLREGSGLQVCTEDAEGLRLREYSPSVYAKYLSYAGYAGSATSAVALIAHLVLFASGGEPKNLPDKNLASLSGSLLLGYASYLAIAVDAVSAGDSWPCVASGLAMHFGFLAAFAWMFVMSADVWFVLHASTKKLRVASGRRTGRFAAYSVFAWLVPAALTALTGALQLRVPAAVDASMAEFRPHLQHNCWFRNPRSLVALFVVPAGATVVANYVSFIGAVRLIATSGEGLNHQSSSTAVSRSRANLRVYVRLSLMMGLAWVFALAGAVTDSDVAWTVNTALNSLQGAFIFLAFDCNWDVTRVLAVFRRDASTTDPPTCTAVTPLSASN